MWCALFCLWHSCVGSRTYTLMGEDEGEEHTHLFYFVGRSYPTGTVDVWTDVCVDDNRVERSVVVLVAVVTVLVVMMVEMVMTLVTVLVVMMVEMVMTVVLVVMMMVIMIMW